MSRHGWSEEELRRVVRFDITMTLAGGNPLAALDHACRTLGLDPSSRRDRRAYIRATMPYRLEVVRDLLQELEP